MKRTQEEKDRTQYVNKLQKKYPRTRRQISYHGCERYSVQFFDKSTSALVADHNLSDFLPDFTDYELHH